ncbi:MULTISPECIES: glycosyl hydrolase [unclassified Microcoleus]|uniref:glycosyl hydrolase n=1 Tax=unclassified Microcoleus TaxID=2642155 RepID=UPI002FD64371
MAKDAVAFVYKTYLPDRTYRIHGPKTVGGSNWSASALQAIPNYFDTVNVHNYDADISNYTRKVRGWMNGTVRANSQLWVGEWGTYEISYGDLQHFRML